MSGIRKSFGGISVLSGVEFDLRRGEVHVLAGENGAGKSTLMKILAGVYGDWEGQILFKGRNFRFRSPRDAFDHGIAVIYQELSLVDSLSVSENLFLGRESTRGLGWLDRRGQEQTAASLLRQVGLEVAPSDAVEELPLPLRQMVEIAKALSRNAEVLVMDEPTSALDEVEVERLFELIRAITKRGCGVIYITHKMEELFRIGDRVTVLRDGRNAGTSGLAGLSEADLVRRMAGKERRSQRPSSVRPRGAEILRLRDLTLHRVGAGKSTGFQGVTLTLHAGEVLGLAGLQGCGNSEVLHAVFAGLGGGVRGTVELLGSARPPRNPAEAVRSHIALLTNDRKGNGLVMELSIRSNITLSALRRLSPGGWLRRHKEMETSGARMAELGIRATSADQEAWTLSGGNQQKVVFAKWLETDPQIFLLDDPTRGVDIGAKDDIYRLILQLRDRGCGIVLISSETAELLALCDRILVMREGKILQEFEGPGVTQEAILHAALGLGRNMNA
jgi:ribose transport system ATP-binding protein